MRPLRRQRTEGEKRMTGTAASLLALSVLILSATSFAYSQGELTKALIGKWEGEIAPPRIGRAQGESGRTLIVTDVREKDGAGSADGRFGITGQTLGAAPISIANAGGKTQLTFTSAGGAAVTLTLEDERTLSGSIKLPRASEERGIRLRKTQ